MTLQDYIYYRIYEYYLKKKDIPVMTGVYFIFVTQYCTVFLIGIIFNFLTNGLLSKENINKELFWFIYLGLASTIFILDLVRYLNKKRRKEIINRFKSSKYNKTIKMWQIFSIPILIVFLAVVVIVIFGDHQ